MSSRRPAVRLLLGVVLGATLFTGTRAQVQFVEVGGARGLGPYTIVGGAAAGFGGGVAAADFDDDGDVDLFVPNDAGVPDQLYRNRGDGELEEIAAAAGLASLDRSRVALWFDYDGDRRLDLFVAGDCRAPEPASCPFDTTTVKLYRQFADAQFAEVTLAAGITDDVTGSIQHRTGLSAGDINGDGYLDLLVGLWQGRARMYVNQADGTFADGGPASGIGAVQTFHHQPVMHDFDGDGLLDVFYAIDFDPNRLWINDGDETFTDAAPSAGVNNAWNDMGVSLGDYDNDGDLDVYVTNIDTGTRHNVLYRNETSGPLPQFTDVAVTAGVASGYWGWGTTFFDVDNDTRLDIAATNGFDSTEWLDDPSKLYLNQGGNPVTFSDVSDASGFNDTLIGSTLLALDYDRDGDLDLLQTCMAGGTQTSSSIRLLENQPSGAAASNRHLVIKPRMVGPNHRAIGAVVRAKIGTLEMMRLITAGTSYLGQEPAEAFFGLGTVDLVDEVTIEWPDGTVSVQPDVVANRVVTIRNTLTLTIEGSELVWFHPDMGPTVSYDIVRGDLGILRSTVGDFSQATQACMDDDRPSNTLPGLPDPDPGEGIWFLVRTDGGSYDDPWGAQSASRDAGIAASPGGCP